MTIFGGLISATALDAFLTPILLLAFGRKPIERLILTTRAEGSPNVPLSTIPTY